jgi:hypothetical protein
VARAPGFFFPKTDPKKPQKTPKNPIAMNEEPKKEETLPPVAAGIWQRLPQETPDAYTAFTIYLDLGFDASLADVAKETGRTPKAINHLSCRA